jgi:hypothetical protein
MTLDYALRWRRGATFSQKSFASLRYFGLYMSDYMSDYKRSVRITRRKKEHVCVTFR